MAQRGALSSDEVNLLIYRHLLEAGFTHTAFVFASESSVSKVDMNAKEVPIGALVSFIQKGFMYMELEANLTEDGTDVYGHYTPVSARDLLTKDTRELREALKEVKSKGRSGGGASAQLDDAGGGSPSAMDVGGDDAGAAAAPAEPVQRQLHGHAGELHSLSWSAPAGVLASASADGTVRVWEVGSGHSVTCAPQGGADAGMMVAVEWAPDGQLLAAATTSGAVFVWGRDGAPRAALRGHAASAVSLQWSRKGDLLASGCAGGSAIVWDVKSGAARQRWAFHGGAVYDLDWRNNSVFAAGLQDGSVAVCRLGADQPVRVCRDHVAGAADSAAGAAEVNAVRWDPAGKLLASASNDMTVRLWAAAGDAAGRVLAGHKREVAALAWRPGGAGGGGGGDDRLGEGPVLASASSDGSVRLWDVERGECVGVLDRHEGGVLCLCWSPDGSRLAAGDEDGNATVWALHRGGGAGRMVGRVVGALQGKGRNTVSDLAWADGGGVLAVAFAGSPAVTLAELK